MGKKAPTRPTDGELEILGVLWSRGPLTCRQVYEVLESKGTSFNTTLKLMQIMHDKGLLVREDARRPHVYRPSASEQQMQRKLVSDFLARAFGGSARKLVAALTSTNISGAELADIRRLLEEAGEDKP
jgi:BlaI family transcriptional regulator, penicillinase repressor